MASPTLDPTGGCAPRILRHPL